MSAGSSSPPDEMPPEVALGITRWVTIYRGVMVVLGGVVAIAVLRLGVLPVAKAVAGTNTNFDFNFSLNLSLAVNVMLGLGLIASERARRRLKRLGAGS